jgi:hypothetical protein
MNFKASSKSLKKILDNMIPFGIAGFLIGLALSFLFMVFYQAGMIALLVAVLAIELMMLNKLTSIAGKRHDAHMSQPEKSYVAPWKQRKPCPAICLDGEVCGSLTTHRKGCPNRKVKT